MTMLERIEKSVILLICVLISNVLAVEKPTSLQKTCVTEECHADYTKKAHVHEPVELGDCKECHKPLKPEEHTWQFVRKVETFVNTATWNKQLKRIFMSP